jgi:hypothetical protein
VVFGRFARHGERNVQKALAVRFTPKGTTHVFIRAAGQKLVRQAGNVALDFVEVSQTQAAGEAPHNDGYCDGFAVACTDEVPVFRRLHRRRKVGAQIEIYVVDDAEDDVVVEFDECVVLKWALSLHCENRKKFTFL